MSALAETVFLRDAREADLDAIAELERRCFPIPWKREYFGVEIDSPHRFNRVARDSRGELAGYVFCAFAGGEIHINKIAVAERWRRRGIARHLMSEVDSLAHRIDAEEIYLEVRPSNLPAIAFYRSLGFAEVGRRAGYYFDGEDALVMLRKLDAPVPSRQTPSGVRLHKWR